MAGVSKNLKMARKYVLKDDEEIIFAVSGSYKTKTFGQDTYRGGILFATKDRVVFFNKRLGGYDSESFKYSNISSIETGKKILGSNITFYASGNEFKMENIIEKHYLDFVEYVDDKIGKKESVIQSDDNLDQLKKLKELLDMDALTQEEYDAKKKQLLDL